MKKSRKTKTITKATDDALPMEVTETVKTSDSYADALAQEELPELSRQETEFVVHFIETDNATAAYRHAYGAEGYSGPALNVQASRKRNSAKIDLWIQVLRRTAGERAACTLEAHVGQLERIREIALATGNIGAAGNAEIARGKACGLYAGKGENAGTQGRGMDMGSMLKLIETTNPVLAAKMAAMVPESTTKH